MNAETTELGEKTMNQVSLTSSKTMRVVAEGESRRVFAGMA